MLSSSRVSYFSRACILRSLLFVLLLQRSCLYSKGGRDSKKSVDQSDTDVILPGERIDKAIVSLQIPEVLNDEAIQVLLCKKFEWAKRLYRFKPQNF
jgi:hypothetical protein